MAWIDGVNYSTGQLITSTIWNNMLGAGGNIDLTAPGVVTTAGDTIYATGDNTIARLPSSGESLKFLRMNAGETAPEYATALTSLVADTSPQLGGFLDANANYIQMQKGGDIASASPTVIDTDGDYFICTGTTSFSAFTVAADRHFFLEFAGVLTITHGAGTIDLPGGANITTAASDVGEFVSTAANVVTCVNYTKADGTSVVAAAGGKILQVVQDTGDTQYSTDSSTLQTIDDPVAAITPSNSSNHVLVIGTIDAYSTATMIILDLQRAISGGATTSGLSGLSHGLLFAETPTAAGHNVTFGQTIVYLDSPSTTSECTYKMMFANENNSTTVYAGYGNTKAVIVLMEVDGT